jgi:hypothetical protein
VLLVANLARSQPTCLTPTDLDLIANRERLAKRATETRRDLIEHGVRLLALAEDPDAAKLRKVWALAEETWLSPRVPAGGRRRRSRGSCSRHPAGALPPPSPVLRPPPGNLGCFAQPAGDDVAQQGLLWAPVLHQAVEILDAYPRELHMLRMFEPWRIEVAVHFDEVVELATRLSIAADPGQFAEIGNDSAQPPAGLLFELAPQRVERCFAWTSVPSGNIPAAWEQSAVIAATVDEGARFSNDDGADHELGHVQLG